MGLNLTLYDSLKGSNEPIIIAVDTSGVGVHRAGGWVERVHGKKKRYVKIHFAVNVETKEVVSMEVTTDDVHDSKALQSLVDKAEQHAEIAEACMDSAYDPSRIYEHLGSKGMEPIIKPRRSSRLDTEDESRRRAVELYKGLGHKEWAKLKRYGRRWMAETAFSTFKRIFGELPSQDAT